MLTIRKLEFDSYLSSALDHLRDLVEKVMRRSPEFPSPCYRVSVRVRAIINFFDEESDCVDVVLRPVATKLSHHSCPLSRLERWRRGRGWIVASVIGCQQSLDLGASRPLALTRNAYKSVNIPHTSCVNISPSSPATGLARRHSVYNSTPESSHRRRTTYATPHPHIPTMSGVTYWLQKQRKGELVDLAKYVNMKEYVKLHSNARPRHSKYKHLTVHLLYSYDNLLKTDLEVALEEHLRANSTKYAQDPKLEPYYRRQAILSPVKRETGSTLITSENENKRPQRARRQTRGAREDTDAP